MDLRGESLLLMASVDFRFNVQHIAIVGGTDAYEGASGQIGSASQTDDTSIDTIRFRK
jgi:hypothetical protein